MYRKWILPAIIWVLYQSLALTWRRTTYAAPSLLSSLKNKNPFILAHWHGDEIPLVYYIGKYRVATIASTSKDGESMNTMIHWVGGKTSRGSSTRGGVSALKGLFRLVKKEGYNCSFSCDGPKGPIYEIKPGVFELSRLLQSEIYTAGVSCDRAWHFPKSWNQTYLPKPFAKIHVVWTGPLGPIEKKDDPRSEELAKTLKNQLLDAKSRASKVIGSAATQL